MRRGYRRVRAGLRDLPAICARWRRTACHFRARTLDNALRRYFSAGVEANWDGL